jgi:hypothetical protein
VRVQKPPAWEKLLSAKRQPKITRADAFTAQGSPSPFKSLLA